mmetsp:Transcript_16756/g.37850  ORF Transcript_16756/g.37850 Transcript_16756/m.37850 type:complete len:273 (+) Transcript_16756:326-1144(+)
MLCLRIILRNAVTELVHDTKAVLGHSVPQIRGPTEERHCLLHVPRHSIAAEVERTQSVHCLGQPLLSSLVDVLQTSWNVHLSTEAVPQGKAQPVLRRLQICLRCLLDQQDSSFFVLCDLGVAQHLTQIEYRLRVPAIPSLLKPLRSFLLANFPAEAVSQHGSRAVHGFEVALLCRRLQPSKSLVHVFRNAVGGEVQNSKLELALGAALSSLLFQGLGRCQAFRSLSTKIEGCCLRLSRRSSILFLGRVWPWPGSSHGLKGARRKVQVVHTPP